MEFIVNDEIKIRKIVAEDADVFFKLISDDETMLYQLVKIVKDRSDSDKILENIVNNKNDLVIGVDNSKDNKFAIEFNGEFIGILEIENSNFGGSKIAMFMDKDHRGKSIHTKIVDVYYNIMNKERERFSIFISIVDVIRKEISFERNLVKLGFKVKEIGGVHSFFPNLDAWEKITILKFNK